jgi:spermidine/putrescine transport system permease protein
MLSLVQNFTRRFGVVMTAYILVASGVWMVGLIILPQFQMVEYSLWSYDRDELSRLDRRIESHYVELQEAQSRIRELESGAGGGDNSGLSPFAGSGSGSGGAELSPDQRQQEIAALESEIAQIKTEIERLEAQFHEPEKEYGFQNYAYLFGNDLHRSIFFKTIWGVSLVTFTALVLCYPIAFYLAKIAPGEQAALLMLGLIVPYWINEILRTFAWLMILSYNGILNTFFQGVGLVSEPINFLSGNEGVLIGMTYTYILFMVFPIYNTIDTLDKNQLEAARDLGAPWWRIHWRIVIPHAKPGIAVGCIMTFMLAAGSYAVPQILGGPSSLWFTQIIYNWFFEGGDWNMGAAYAFVLLLICLSFILLMMRLFRVSLHDIAK